jgi:S-adenosylmethionine synthetase
MSANGVKEYLFASESVSPGHPDKCCDQVSDSILDACLQEDPNSHVAVETTVKGNTIGLYGEISTNNKNLNCEKIVRETLRRIGYSSEAFDMNPNTCSVLINIREQESQIGDIVHDKSKASKESLGAGDQGLMFGYATNETDDYMPMSLVLSHALQRKLREKYDYAQQHKEERPPFWWLRTDAKSQVVVKYREENGVLTPLYAKVAVLSVQHSESIDQNEMSNALYFLVIDVLQDYNMFDPIETEIKINAKQQLSCTPWTIGGPNADAGTTGRKIIVDTYGGHGAHGGGAFSGKDPSKVDRSAAYYARYVAKSLVHAKLCQRVLIQISYVIGSPKPLNIYVNTFGTVLAPMTDEKLLEIITMNFDFRPGMIIDELGLTSGSFKYADTAVFGHFGGTQYPWEQTKTLMY